MEKLVIALLNGLTLTMIISLIALGLAVIFGLRGVINLAHGEFFMLGGYVVVAADQYLPTYWAGLFLAPIVIGAIGWVVERLIIRHLYRKPLDTLLATWGLSIVFREGVRMTIGAGYKYTHAPFTGNFHLLGVDYPLYRLFIIAAAAVIFIVVLVFFLHTKYGIQIKAAIYSRENAESLGINTSRIDQVVFIIGSALAGFAGAIMSPIIALNPNIGIDFFAKSFLVVIVGGVGSIYGALAGSGLIGGGESLLSAVIRPIVAQAFILFLAMIVIRVRPQGLFRK
jgi:urea transport system permease protein